MHPTHRKILDQLKIHIPNIKMSEYIALLNAAISGTEHDSIYPLEREHVVIDGVTNIPHELPFEFVIIEKVYATGASSLAGFPSPTDREYFNYTTRGNEITIPQKGSYIIQYRYRPEIIDENTDPMIPISYIQSLVEGILYHVFSQADMNRAMVFLQNSKRNAANAHIQESRRQRRSILKPLF